MESKPNIIRLIVFGILLVSLFVFVYLFAGGKLNMGISGSFTYIIYILLGLIASVICYGLLSSFGEIQGHKYETTIKLGGAIVGLVVVGGGGLVYEKYFHTPDGIDVRVVFYTEGKNVIQRLKGQAIVFYGNTEKDVPVNNEGSILLQGIPARLMNSRLDISLDCPDFEIDTTGGEKRLMTADQPVYVKVKLKKSYATAREANVNLAFIDVSAVDYVKRPDAKDIIVRVNAISNSDLLIPIDKYAHLQILMNSGAPLVDMELESSNPVFLSPRNAGEIFYEGFLKLNTYKIASGRTAILTVRYKDVTGGKQSKEWNVDFDFAPRQ